MKKSATKVLKWILPSHQETNEWTIEKLEKFLHSLIFVLLDLLLDHSSGYLWFGDYFVGIYVTCQREFAGDQDAEIGVVLAAHIYTSRRDTTA